MLLCRHTNSLRSGKNHIIGFRRNLLKFFCITSVREMYFRKYLFQLVFHHDGACNPVLAYNNGSFPDLFLIRQLHYRHEIQGYVGNLILGNQAVQIVPKRLQHQSAYVKHFSILFFNLLQCRIHHWYPIFQPKAGQMQMHQHIF